MQYGEVETDKYILFYGGIFSQWYKSDFTIGDITYSSAEQYMMANKADVFNDSDSLKEIMATDDPRRQKAIGRKVKGFEPEKWNEVAKRVVLAANVNKFTASQELKKAILSTGNKIIVEASPYDKIWGIGLAPDDPKALDESTWEGTNWLGEAVMEARKIIRSLESVGEFPGDTCNRDGCGGTLDDLREGGCSCHISPPCSYCCETDVRCNECDWEHQYQA